MTIQCRFALLTFFNVNACILIYFYQSNFNQLFEIILMVSTFRNVNKGWTRNVSAAHTRTGLDTPELGNSHVCGSVTLMRLIQTRP
jgi:hypothetical protein